LLIVVVGQLSVVVVEKGESVEKGGTEGGGLGGVNVGVEA
jgi:hypothetical protein